MERTKLLDLPSKIGETVTINGWVNRQRKLGSKLVFIDLRDRSAIAQVVLPLDELTEQEQAVALDARAEWVLEIEGIVNKRGEKQINFSLPTGSIEVLAKKVRLLNKSLVPPFEIDNEERQANEELRLKYRYLDLRHDRMKRNIELRYKIIKYIRDWLDKKEFWEIETPLLTKGTPEGAREYVVPSRLHKGKYYVLPQSPQQFKQLLMVAGMERYFQIARCFRDEDQRGDRQPEFTQLDMEMSFVEQEDVMKLNEQLFIDLIQHTDPDKKIQEIPFPRLTYQQAMDKYGTDHPDLRTDKNNPNLLAFCWIIDFPFFEKTEEGGWTFTHNPFSAPKPEWQESLVNKKDIGKIITSQYDVVLNGYEIGGGSIRNHQPEMLRKVFEIMGFNEEQIKEQFGHMLEALQYGAPPHGGIAWGLDRLLAILCNEPNIREVIAFPKTSDAKDLMMSAPSDLPKQQLKDVGLI
ncbi:MAG: aspartate--tRNA ligase [bacterium]